MTDIATDQERPVYRGSLTAPYTGMYREYDDIPEIGPYEITEGDLREAEARGVPLQCNECDNFINEGFWVSKGLGEVPVCTSCKEKKDEVDKRTTAKLMDLPLDEVPESTQVWVSDIVDAITLPMITLLDAVEGDFRLKIIEHIRQELDEYDYRGFRKGPLSQ